MFIIIIIQIITWFYNKIRIYNKFGLIIVLKKKTKRIISYLYVIEKDSQFLHIEFG